MSTAQPECYPAHAKFPKCQRPNGRGWNLTWGRARERKHDVCSLCEGCYDCANGCTSDPILSTKRLGEIQAAAENNSAGFAVYGGGIGHEPDHITSEEVLALVEIATGRAL